MTLMAVRYNQRGTFAGVEFHDTPEEALAVALGDGCPLATVGPRTKGAPRFFAHDGGGWREVSGDEFERLRGLEEPGTLPRSRNRESEPPTWRWAA